MIHVIFSVMAAASIANIVKSSLGPVGLDKMLVDDIGVCISVHGHFGHRHFGLGRFGLDISATENAEGGRYGHNHKFWVWDVCMQKCVMHFIIF